MKSLILLFFTYFVAFTSLGQDCSKELLKEKPGTWKMGMQGSTPNVTATDLAKEKSVVASIHKFVSTKYKPTGCQIQYAGAYGKYPSPGQSWIGDPYYYSMYVLRYLCDPNSADRSKYYVDYSTPTVITIASNVVFGLELYAADVPSDDVRGYLKLKARPVKKDGYYFMGEEVVGDHHLPNKIKEYRWLVTYGDTLPFTYLNRKEYLLIQKKRVERSIVESPSEKGYYEKFLANINDYLKKPDDELNEAAICMWNEEQRFEKFVPEGTLGSFIAVKPNLAYYRKKLPKSSPQFFSVVYKIAHGDPVFEENVARIQKAIDFTTLKNMLGK